MFLAIREWFFRKRDRTPGRKRRIAKLFLFEFVIVVLGVLTAQLLSEAVVDSRQRQDARAALALAKGEASVLLALAEISEETAPCLRERSEALLGIAMSGGTVPPEALEAPLLPSVQITPWSDRLVGAVRDNFGGSTVGRHAILVSNAESITNANTAITQAWAEYELLAQEFGGVSEREQEELRQAAIDLRRSLRSRQLTIDSLRRNIEGWEVEPAEEYRQNYYDLADECGFAKD
ncbi:hypothetical protein [Aurantiacibacter sp. MUD61]|uniref:hypothetical protein n=1 Tax=Aurantiacibacter sp. MUD61 TaxID=3009083 RepID=UPI0022F07738|nr:hypothetical protein [Aurantiacibacter sp. MUD61]